MINPSMFVETIQELDQMSASQRGVTSAYKNEKGDAVITWSIAKPLGAPKMTRLRALRGAWEVLRGRAFAMRWF